MGSVDDRDDTAMTGEPFRLSFKCELIDRQRLRTHAETRPTILEFI